jgi:hypothetical protein
VNLKWPVRAAADLVTRGQQRLAELEAEMELLRGARLALLAIGTAVLTASLVIVAAEALIPDSAETHYITVDHRG